METEINIIETWVFPFIAFVFVYFVIVKLMFGKL